MWYLSLIKAVHSISRQIIVIAGILNGQNPSVIILMKRSTLMWNIYAKILTVGMVTELHNLTPLTITDYLCWTLYIKNIKI